MELPDIVKEYFSTVLMMYVLCLVGFFPGSLDIWLTITCRRTGGASIAVRKVNLPEAQIVSMG